MLTNKPLPREFYNRSPETVARELIGKLLVRKLERTQLVGKIVETEAYLGEHDPAAHAAKGRSQRTEVMYGPPGYAYIFQIHRYHCLNVVTEETTPSCVLLRALEPVSMELANTNGPGKLCLAMDITKDLYGVDMTVVSSPLFIVNTSEEHPEIETSSRIGISKAVDWPLRFTAKDNPFVSR